VSLLAVATLWRRELVRFFRQPSRVAGAAGSPLLFWVLIGSGLSGSFRLPGAPPGAGAVSYLEYFFPGTVVLALLFAAIFSTISVIEDRHLGFLQGVLAAPVSRGSIVAGKVLGGATLAWLQAVPFLILAPFAGIHLTLSSALGAAGVLAVLAVALTAIGFAFAWRVDSVQGFHAVMNLLLVPMWLLSGAFFPVAGAPVWLRALMRANPMTYGVAALRGVLYGGTGSGGAAAAGPGLPGPAAATAITALLALAGFAFGLAATRGGRID
jgi:ABC-2 type transport system permease protein